MIAKLYSLFTVRDDFKDLILIANENDNDKQRNYIVHDDEHTTFYINIFKTKSITNPDIVWSIPMTLPEGRELHILLSNYILNRHKVIGDNLFGKTSLSSYVGDMHEKLKYKKPSQNINLFRHMKASDSSEKYKNKEMTFAQREEIVRIMSNSLLTNDSYVRLKKTI